MAKARCASRLSIVFALAFGGLAAPHALAAAAKPTVHKTTQSESYIMVEPIYASILDGTKPRGLLLVEFGLDVPDAGFRTRVNDALPVLRDAYMRSLLVYGATAVRAWRQPSVDDIAGRMQAITDRVMGHPGAKVLMAQTAIRISP